MFMIKQLSSDTLSTWVDLSKRISERYNILFLTLSCTVTFIRYVKQKMLIAIQHQETVNFVKQFCININKCTISFFKQELNYTYGMDNLSWE